MPNNLLEIENLSVHFHIPEGVARAVDDVSFAMAPGETLGLVGESGCGKSVTSLSILEIGQVFLAIILSQQTHNPTNASSQEAWTLNNYYVPL